MTAQTGVLTCFHIFIMVHEFRGVSVIMAFGATDDRGLACLDCRVALAAGCSLVILFDLGMAGGAVAVMNLLEAGVIDVLGSNIRIVAFLAAHRLGTTVEVVMAFRAVIDVGAMFEMIKEHGAGGGFEITPVGGGGVAVGQAADYGRQDRDE